jgi:hypothetical protein
MHEKSNSSYRLNTCLLGTEDGETINHILLEELKTDPGWTRMFHTSAASSFFNIFILYPILTEQQNTPLSKKY